MADEEQSLGDLVDRFAAFHHMDPADVAGFLGIAPSRLSALRGHTLPGERDVAFAARVATAAAAADMSPVRLAQVARVARLLR